MNNSDDLDIFSALDALLVEEDHYKDPGEEDYDVAHEDQVRTLMELTAFYDESGPRSDPEGEYLCGTCNMRQGIDRCLYVSGEISFTEGSCDIYVHGDALPETYKLKEKFIPEEMGYALRPETKAFGCSRCSYGAEAKAPDPDGRPSWCKEWGVHILPTACCKRHSADDLIKIVS